MGVNPATLICTERYPVGDKGHPAVQRLCTQAQTALAQHSVFVLPDFVRPETLQQMREEANALAPWAHHMDVVTPLYPERQEHEVRAHHPVRRARVRTSVRAISYARIPPDSALRALYEWDPLLEFVAALLGLPRIYRYQDAHGALNIAVMVAGDEFGWHVDQTDFVVSLVLQAPEAGGEFLCRPALRPDAEADDAAVQAVLENRCPQIATVPMHAGSFMLFQGRHALHRVTPIQGQVPRLVALLAYDTKPGTVSSPALLKARYGVDEHTATGKT
jgi:hypothetical protein